MSREQSLVLQRHMSAGLPSLPHKPSLGDRKELDPLGVDRTRASKAKWLLEIISLGMKGH